MINIVKLSKSPFTKVKKSAILTIANKTKIGEIRKNIHFWRVKNEKTFQSARFGIPGSDNFDDVSIL